MKIAAVGDTGGERRTQLTRERVLAAAIELADRDGIEAVSMRRLAADLGVEAMSLYTHVRNKEGLLDGMVDALIGEIPIPVQDAADDQWKTTLRRLVFTARGVMLRHPWAPRVIETRKTSGPAVPRYVNAVLGVLRRGGFTVAQTHHALHIMGSRLLGFSQDLFDDSEEPDPQTMAVIAGEMARTLPYAAEMALAVTHDGHLGRCDDEAEFAFTLDFILDGLERLRDAASPSGSAHGG